MKRPVATLMALSLTLALVVPLASARTFGPAISPAVAQEETAASLYTAWYEARQKDTVKGIEIAKRFLEKFPDDKNAVYMKAYLGSLAVLFHFYNEAAKAKNTPEMIRLAREIVSHKDLAKLEQDKQDQTKLDYLYSLTTSIFQNEISATPPNLTHASEASEFALQVVKLIEGGKQPSYLDKAKWVAKDQYTYFYQNLASAEEKKQNPDKAMEYYMKASTIDPSNTLNYLSCGRLHNVKYAALAQKYQAIPEADRNDPNPKPEVKAALDEANKEADAVIECWAKYLALAPAGNANRPTIEKVVTDYYKYRHPDAPDGLQKLIEQYRASLATSANNATNTSSKN